MATVHHRYRTVDGHRLFFREAGDPEAPAVVLLHGFPTSSYMFRHLLPVLADRYHVIAPDHLGFGLSDAPPVEDFDYTFDALTALTAGLLATLGIDRYAMYVPSGGAATRSSARPAPKLSLKTCRTRRSICSTAATSYSNPP